MGGAAREGGAIRGKRAAADEAPRRCLRPQRQPQEGGAIRGKRAAADEAPRRCLRPQRQPQGRAARTRPRRGSAVEGGRRTGRATGWSAARPLMSALHYGTTLPRPIRGEGIFFVFVSLRETRAGLQTQSFAAPPRSLPRRPLPNLKSNEILQPRGPSFPSASAQKPWIGSPDTHSRETIFFYTAPISAASI
jgi:hypothetical protein